TSRFKDIGHDINIHDVTYENSQARERTQILMDIAIGNLEVTLGGKPYSGYPCFSAPDDFLFAMTDLQQNSDYGNKTGQYPAESRAILSKCISFVDAESQLKLINDVVSESSLPEVSHT
ncbi:DUF4972 domain-containing protein, partial [Bacteroides sp. 224]|uniref:DUF4972 domain-containing protein n=1 Tax=Bacteroides sp. 224 TaxID=2302936 RepID=UPI0013D8581F